MTTEASTRTVIAIALAAALLLWPAIWNGYPLVFSDTGTYLSQAIERHASWDRPVFYSLFLLPLHMTLTTWPAIVVQALLVAHVLHLVRRTLLPAVSVWWLLPLVGAMALTTSLPWFVSQLSPDVFTGTVVLALALLIVAPERLSQHERIWMMAFATFMIAAHQSHVLLVFVLLAVLLPWWRPRMTAVVPLVVAIVAMVSVNLIAFGRPSLSPFGNTFLLARVIYDGPGMDLLRRDCPESGWRLCASVDRMPASADDFLWRDDGPVARAGGGTIVSGEADAIITASVLAEPGAEMLAFTRNALRQLMQFASGDGLQSWPETVTPTMERDFPRFETAAYRLSRQSIGTLAVPAWMQTLHTAVALAGIAGCCVMVWIRNMTRGFAAAVLLALVANAAITGGLSGPHDRYQSRIMWLPPLITLLGIASLRTR